MTGPTGASYEADKALQAVVGLHKLNAVDPWRLKGARFQPSTQSLNARLVPTLEI
jgi:hypothetical protein